MHIVITIDSTQDLSPVDRTILTLLGDSTRYGREGFRPATGVAHPEPTDEEPVGPSYPNDGPGHPAPAEEKPKRKRRTKAEIEAERAAAEAPADEQGDPWTEGQPEPEAVSEAPEAAEEQLGEVTPKTIDKWREEAVAKATEAVAAGNRAKVKAALDAVGASKVSTLADDQLAAFLGALSE